MDLAANEGGILLKKGLKWDIKEMCIFGKCIGRVSLKKSGLLKGLFTAGTGVSATIVAMMVFIPRTPEDDPFLPDDVNDHHSPGTSVFLANGVRIILPMEPGSRV